MQRKQPSQIKIKIYGKYSSPELYYTIDELGRFSDHLKSQQQLLSRINLETIPMHETHFDYFLKDLKKTLPQFIKHRKNAPIILINNKEYLSNAKDLISTIVTKLKLTNSYLLADYFMENFEDHFNKYVKAAQICHKKSLQQDKKKFVYIDYSVSKNNLFSKPKFRIIIQLQSDIAPKTCQNFIHLCQDCIEFNSNPNYILLGDMSGSNGLPLSYKFSKIQRFYKDFFFVAGDNNGTGGNSIYGENFEDETRTIKHDMAGVLGMSHRGQRHSNGSQFYITLTKIKDFDGKYVAFGQVLYGLKNIRKINKIQNKGDVYLPFEVSIENCGIYEYDEQDFQNDFQKFSNDVFEEITTKAPTMAKEYDEILNNNYQFMYQPHLVEISTSFGKSTRPQTVPTQGGGRSRSKKLPVDISKQEQSTYSLQQDHQKSCYNLAKIPVEIKSRVQSPE